MTTHQTRSSIRTPVDEDRGGLLRLALKLDAAASGTLAVLSLAASSVLGDLLGIPLALLVPVGLLLIGWAAALWVIASHPRIGGAPVRVVILLNLLYAVDGVVVVATGLFPLTASGIAFVLFQVFAVTLFAAVQFTPSGRGANYARRNELPRDQRRRCQGGVASTLTLD